MPKYLLFLVLGYASLVSSSALAVDGVIEINQAGALTGGITPTDTPGFPVTIDSAGSYRLTGNLSLAGLGLPIGTSVVDIDTNDVSLDLGGFAIVGSGTSCSPCSAYGVDGVSSSGIVVRNGTVRNVSGTGISLGGWGHVENVAAISNRGDGVRAVEGDVSHVQARSNGSIGIVLSGTGTVSFSQVFLSGSTGIWVGYGSITNSVVGSNGSGGVLVNGRGGASNIVSTFNTGTGIRVFDGWIRDSVSAQNQGPGFSMENGVMAGNLARQNNGNGFVGNASVSVSDCTADSNVQNGFVLRSGALVHSSAIGNGAVALSAFPSGRLGYGANVLADDQTAIVQQGASVLELIGPNICGTDLTCP